MKKLLLILLCLPFIGFGQKTYVPDDGFEYLLEIRGLGDGLINNDSVWTSSIDTIQIFDQTTSGGIPHIFDLTGIEDFVVLEHLIFADDSLMLLDLTYNNSLLVLELLDSNIDTLDLTNNSNLIQINIEYVKHIEFNNHAYMKQIRCEGLNTSTINLSGMPLLEEFISEPNPGRYGVRFLDFSNNPNMRVIDCDYNDSLIGFVPPPSTFPLVISLKETNISGSLDLSYNIELAVFIYWPGSPLPDSSNSLYALNIANGNNLFLGLKAISPLLNCIQVDDSIWATNNWLSTNGVIYPTTIFSENCNGLTSIKEYTTNKELLKVIDLLGRETKGKKNQPLFYLYDDGTVEKKIIIE